MNKGKGIYLFIYLLKQIDFLPWIGEKVGLYALDFLLFFANAIR